MLKSPEFISYSVYRHIGVLGKQWIVCNQCPVLIPSNTVKGLGLMFAPRRWIGIMAPKAPSRPEEPEWYSFLSCSLCMGFLRKHKLVFFRFLLLIFAAGLVIFSPDCALILLFWWLTKVFYYLLSENLWGFN